MSNSETAEDAPPDLELCRESHSTRSSSSSTRSDYSPEKGSASPLSCDQVAGTEELVVANKPISFSVRGLYTKYYPTDEELETYEPEFVLCRRRMRTRPMDSFSSKDSVMDSEEVGDESNNEQYETAMFQPVIGLVGAQFWHEEDEEAKVVREDRAILFQSQENYERLIANVNFAECFECIDYMENPTFGEQLIVNGCETSDLAIGDVFEIDGGHSTLVVEITSPRKPCSYINLKHDTVMGVKGIQAHTHQNCLAGWFARVLVAGELREGMKFTRKSHPNPKWTLTYIYKALYGEGNRLQSMMNASSWNRDRAELEELIALPQLAEYEWKAEGRKRLMQFDKVDWKTVRYDSIDPQFDWDKWALANPEEAFMEEPPKTSNDFLQFFCMPEIIQTISEALRQFCL